MENVGNGIWKDEDAAIRFRCEWEGCGIQATYWDYLSDEMPLCREHALYTLGKRKRKGIGEFVKISEERATGNKLCQSCQKRYDGNYISHKPNCNKRWS